MASSRGSSQGILTGIKLLCLLHWQAGSLPPESLGKPSFPSGCEVIALSGFDLHFLMTKRNINNLRYADDTTHMAESEEELKSLLMKVKAESELVDLKLNIQKTKIMDPVPSLHGK